MTCVFDNMPGPTLIMEKNVSGKETMIYRLPGNTNGPRVTLEGMRISGQRPWMMQSPFKTKTGLAPLTVRRRGRMLLPVLSGEKFATKVGIGILQR